jgi:glutathione S-transferase
MALACAEVNLELREVLLREKPVEMLAVSPKGSVPVLVLESGRVIDESLDIMRWALNLNDPLGWLAAAKDSQADALIAENDGAFKEWLDKYKYADRYPAEPPEFYRSQAERYLQQLDGALGKNAWLCGSKKSIADVALFPFIRQFAMVDRPWFDQSPYHALRRWLALQLSDELFLSVMHKCPRWTGEEPGVNFPER